MLREGLRGAAAGAVALDITTCADMAVRGRPASNTPAQVAEKLTQAVGLDLAPSEESSGSKGKKRKAAEAAESTKQQRLSGLGALMGYATGLGMGVLYGLTRPYLGRLSLPLAGAVLGAAAMAGSDVPAVVTGATDPKTWGASGWLADIVPHAVYGLVTVLAYELFDDE